MELVQTVVTSFVVAVVGGLVTLVMTGQFRSLHREMDARFEAADGRFDALDRRFDSMDRRLERVDASIDVSTARMAAKIRFGYEDLETTAEGTLDTRGRRGLADVPVHYSRVDLLVRIRTDESDARLGRLTDLVARYCPVDSLIRAAVPDYHVTWERMP